MSEMEVDNRILIAEDEPVSQHILEIFLRREIESPRIMTPVGEIQVTASLGIAVSFNSKSVGPDSLIQAADTALYSAKEKGRNRSETADQGQLATSAATIPAE
jgi:diguanylate cyclase (GGDEF)-like protein